MFQYSIKTIFFFIVILIHNSCFSQDYSINVVKSSFEIDGNTYKGYEAQIDRPYKEVKKEWWKYIKKKAHLENFLTHYELNMPSDPDEVQVILISTLSEPESGHNPTLKLGVKPDGLADKQFESAITQTKKLLIDFKVNYYTELLQDEIQHLEKNVIKLDSEINKTESGSEERIALEKRKRIEQASLEKAKDQLKTIR